MRRFIVNLFAFAIIIVLCDILFGYAGNKLENNAFGGNTKRRHHIACETNEDLLVFGSSRAMYQYNPEILEDTLGLSVYNCGFRKAGIFCAYGFLTMTLKRYHPKYVVYEITYDYDLTAFDNHHDLENLRFFYDRPEIDTIFRDIDPSEQYKMISRMYRLNSLLPELVMNNLYVRYGYDKGFFPMGGELAYEPEPLENNLEYDSLKLHYIEKMIKECEGKTRLIFAESPMYGNTSDSILSPLKTLCAKYDVPLINLYTDRRFIYRKDYFYDSFHLNARGATEYSKVVAREIKDLLANDVDAHGKVK